MGEQPVMSELRLEPYTVPEEDADLWGCGVRLLDYGVTFHDMREVARHVASGTRHGALWREIERSLQRSGLLDMVCQRQAVASKDDRLSIILSNDEWCRIRAVVREQLSVLVPETVIDKSTWTRDPEFLSSFFLSVGLGTRLRQHLLSVVVVEARAPVAYGMMCSSAQQMYSDDGKGKRSWVS